MFIVVTGGSGSGKSEFAENLAVRLYKEQMRLKKVTHVVTGTKQRPNPILYYVATMHAYDEESRNRIKRHREQRAGKGFVTVERQTELEYIKTECSDVVLLEDLSNLLANELYLQTGRIKDHANRIPQMRKTIFLSILQLVRQTGSLVLVTNEVFSDGVEYEEETKQYLQLLGRLNQGLAQEADGVVEVVCGIPIWQKELPIGKVC